MRDVNPSNIIVRYGDTLKEPIAVLSKYPRIKGLDGNSFLVELFLDAGGSGGGIGGNAVSSLLLIFIIVPISTYSDLTIGATLFIKLIL